MTELERLDGLYVGQLSEGELWIFEHAVKEGIAFRSYEGALGFMQLAKVRFNREIARPNHDRS